MVLVVADSSALILLCKIDLLELLCNKHEIIIPEEVYKESIDDGLIERHPDALRLKQLTDCKKIKIQKVGNMKILRQLVEVHGLGKGEAEAICLISEGKASVVALDDFKGIKYCERLKIPFTTTIRLILDSLQDKVIDQKTATEMIKELAVKGRYSNQIIFDALEKLEGEKNG